MRENFSEIICIVDRSGSMHSIKDDAIGGFNQFLEDQQAVPGEANLTLVLFSHEYILVHDAVPLPQVEPLTDKTYQPSGSTALLDAVGRTIDDVGKRLAKTAEPERPSQVLVAIITDGQENASSDYSKTRLAEMIQHQEEKYAWQFFFLGANIDSFSTAGGLNIKKAQTANFAATAEGVRNAYKQHSEWVTQARQRKNK